MGQKLKGQRYFVLTSAGNLPSGGNIFCSSENVNPTRISTGSFLGLSAGTGSLNFSIVAGIIFMYMSSQAGASAITPRLDTIADRNPGRCAGKLVPPWKI